MKRNLKTIVCALLCLVFVTAMFVACGDEKEPATSTPAVESSQTEPSSAEPVSTDESSSETSTERDHLNDPLIYKGNAYSGQTLTFLVSGYSDEAASEYMYNEDATEEQIPATVNNAIAERNNKVFAALGVTVKSIYISDKSRFGGTTLTKIREALSTADHDSWQVASLCLYDCGTLAMEDSLYDLASIETLNIENPWWEQSFNASVSMNNKLYFTVGDIAFNHKDSTPCVFYNADLFNDIIHEDPVEVVVAGEWTIDKALEYSKMLCIDSAAPEGIDYLDQFGWAGQWDDMYSMLYGAGVKILTPGADRYPSLTLNNDVAVGTVEKVVELMLDRSYVSGNNYFGVSATPMTLLETAFEEGRCLFYSGGIDTAKMLDMEDVFGILPVPKYSKEQEQYYSLMNTWTTNAICVPNNCDEETAEFVGAVIDVMGYYSWKEYPDSVAFNYYEKMLKNQKLVREDSEAMLDRIFEARGCELGAIFQIGKLSGTVAVNEMLGQLITEKDGSQFVSKYKTYEPAFVADLETVIGYFGES